MWKLLVALCLLPALSLGPESAPPVASHSVSLPVSGFSQAPCGYFPQVRVRPVLPTLYDPITIIASGDWPNSCIPGYQSHQRIGNTIELIVAEKRPPGINCLWLITRWESAVDIGKLPAGSYEVHLYIERTGSPDGPALCAVRPFEVSDPRYRIYVPTILNGL